MVKAFEAWIFKENTKEENGILYAIRGGFMLFYVLTMMLIMAGVAFILMWSLVNLVVLLVGALTPGPA